MPPRKDRDAADGKFRETGADYSLRGRPGRIVSVDVCSPGTAIGRRGAAALAASHSRSSKRIDEDEIRADRDFFRQQAEKCRLAAADTDNEHVRRGLERLAALYEDMARQLNAGAGERISSSSHGGQIESGPTPDTVFGISSDPLVEASLAAVLERVPEIVHARRAKLTQDNIDLLVDAYLKTAPTAPARHQIEMDNARERARFVEEYPCYTSRELAELAGHEAANASATAARWKKGRRIVGLPWKGSDLYPAFQFSEGRPRPVIERIIAALPQRFSPWQIAFWLTSSNSWLGGAAPLDRLDEEDALIAAATRESEMLGG